MPVLRKEINKNFTTVHNYFIRDITLPLCCKGMLLLMISLPENWNFSIAGLQAIVYEGRDKVRSTLKALEKAGYLKRTRITDEKGIICDWEYIFSDEPIFREEYESDNTSDADKYASSEHASDKTFGVASTYNHPHTDSTQVGCSQMASSQVDSTPYNKIKNTKKQNEKGQKEESCGAAAQPDSVSERKAAVSVMKSPDKAANEAIIAYLNEKAHTHFKKDNPVNSNIITTKMLEGYSIDDFKTVIDHKCAEWLGTDMAKYLRPKTLFGSKFAKYLGVSRINCKQAIQNPVNNYDSDMIDLLEEYLHGRQS